MKDQKTWVSITFQYKHLNQLRPVDAVQEEELSFEAPYGDSIAALPIPSVGDSVVLTLNSDKRNAYKVLTRQFTFLKSDLGLNLNVNIVVTDLDEDEYLARIKQ